MHRFIAVIAALIMGMVLAIAPISPAQAVTYSFSDASAWKSEGYGTETRIVVVWDYDSLSDRGRIKAVRYQVRNDPAVPWYVEGASFKGVQITGRFFAHINVYGWRVPLDRSDNFNSLTTPDSDIPDTWLRMRTDDNGLGVFGTVEIVATGPAPNLDYDHKFKIKPH